MTATNGRRPKKRVWLDCGMGELVRCGQLGHAAAGHLEAHQISHTTGYGNVAAIMMAIHDPFIDLVGISTVRRAQSPSHVPG